MDSQNTTTSTTTFLPPPIDVEASAPLAQPDDDFVVPLSAAGTPNTPADDGGTGSTVSPVSPIHINRQQALMMDDDQPTSENGATDDNAGLLPPPEETESEEKPNKDAATTAEAETKTEDDDQVPVLAMSGILPATATGGDAKKSTGGGGNDSLNDSGTGGTGTGNGDTKSKDKSRFTSGSGVASGTDMDDSGNTNSPPPMGCGTTMEYMTLIIASIILLLSVTCTTVYWITAYRHGYDPNWFPWPPQTPKQLLSVGVFTYKHPQNLTNTSNDDDDISTTTTTTISFVTEQSPMLNSTVPYYITEARRFNLHPTLMTIGFVTFTGLSILVYRLAAGMSTSCRGTSAKMTHGLLHLATVPCVVFGGIAAMEYHRLKGLPHLYSLHSWMGLLTVSLFIIQFTLGFFTFVILLCCRGATAACRLRCFAPIHATLGLCTFTLAIATCLTGLQQRADFVIFDDNETFEITAAGLIKKKLYSNNEYLVINVLAVLLVFVLVVVSYILRRESFRRKPNNKSPFTATVSPLRLKSSSSTAKFGSGKQSSQLPI